MFGGGWPTDQQAAMTFNVQGQAGPDRLAGMTERQASAVRLVDSELVGH